MKRFTICLALAAMTVSVMAQSFTVYQNGNSQSFNDATVDSVVFSEKNVKEEAAPSKARFINARWCSLGTSISWLNDNTANYPITKGYQTRVLEKLGFVHFTNKAVNGGCIESARSAVVMADYYTIEHGINDWGKGVPPGTIEDYIANRNNGTFAAYYRQVINQIFTRNPRAKVVLCTPRKAYGFDGYLPAHWYDAKNGIYLKEYADLVKQIAAYESFPVADFFEECGGQRQLKYLSYDEALHPNDAGFQMMANVLIQALEKVITE